MSLQSSLISEPKRVDLKYSWQLLKKWVDDHPRARVISLSAVANYFRDQEDADWVSLIHIADVLAEYVSEGKLVRKYAVESSGGDLLYPYYDSKLDVPPLVPNEFTGDVVETASADIVPVYSEP